MAIFHVLFDKLIGKQSVIYFLLVSLGTGKKIIEMKICSYVRASFEEILIKQAI